MTSVTQTEAFAKLDEGTLKDFISKVGYMIFTKKEHIKHNSSFQAAQAGAFKS